MIGNSAYSDAIGPLKNPKNDATDLAAALKTLGFEVTPLLDLNKQAMIEAVEAFSKRLPPDGVGLFYFAGHGVEGSDGRNYLLPTDVRITSPVDVQYNSIGVDWVLARMGEAGERATTLLILDACRNAPFRGLWRSSPSGFSAIPAPGGALVAYATAPGKLAAEKRAERNGLYTKHLLAALKQVNLPVELMFKQVRLAVEAEARAVGVAQTPWEASSLRGEFAFNVVAAAPVVTPPTPTPAPVTPVPTPAPVTPSRVQEAVGVYPSDGLAPGIDGAPMVRVPAGEFLMGSNDGGADEKPPHRVFLDTFAIDTYEVTNARFQQFVQATNYRTTAERAGDATTWRQPRAGQTTLAGLEQHPVVQVSQEDAKAYCQWAGKRLPTEAEWEKVARGTDGRTYPWGKTFDGSRLNFCDKNCQFDWKDQAVNDGYQHTAPVGQYESGKSPYGAYDMAGNVWEWVADFYDENYYKNSPARNPKGPDSSNRFVVRGGSWTVTRRTCARRPATTSRPRIGSTVRGSGVPGLCNSFFFYTFSLGGFCL